MHDKPKNSDSSWRETYRRSAERLRCPEWGGQSDATTLERQQERCADFYSLLPRLNAKPRQ